jgi:endonuclease/exonuclease/phosphatase (EEP) superfamily protein YafD
MSARYAGFAGIPIDLALVSANVRVVERCAGPDLGSDHLPVLTRIAY